MYPRVPVCSGSRRIKYVTAFFGQRQFTICSVTFISGDVFSVHTQSLKYLWRIIQSCMSTKMSSDIFSIAHLRKHNTSIWLFSVNVIENAHCNVFILTCIAATCESAHTTYSISSCRRWCDHPQWWWCLGNRPVAAHPCDVLSVATSLCRGNLRRKLFGTDVTCAGPIPWCGNHYSPSHSSRCRLDYRKPPASETIASYAVRRPYFRHRYFPIQQISVLPRTYGMRRDCQLPEPLLVLRSSDDW